MATKTLYKAFRYRVYPTKEQKEYFMDHFEANKYIYNTMLKATIDKYSKEADERFLDYISTDKAKAEIERLKEKGTTPEWRDFVKKGKKGAKGMSMFDMQKIVTELVKDPNVPWISKKYDAWGMRLMAENVQLAFDGFYRGGGYPKFKKIGQITSISFLGSSKAETGGNNTIAADVQTNTIKLPKIKDLKGNIHREPIGIIKIATLRMVPSGKWYLSVTAKYQKEVSDIVFDKVKTVAIDQGLKHFLTLYTPDFETVSVIDSPRFWGKNSLKLAKAQRVVSRRYQAALKDREEFKQKEAIAKHLGDWEAEQEAVAGIQSTYLYNRENYKKAKREVGKISEDIAEQRKYFLHSLSRDIINRYDTIILEGFSVQDTIQRIKNDEKLSNKHKLNIVKKITDLSWYDFRLKLEQKAQMDGKRLIILPDSFKANGHCSNCGSHFEKPIPVTMEEFTCKYCSTILERSVNSAKNILEEGLKVSVRLDKVKTIADTIEAFDPTLRVQYKDKTESFVVKEIIREKKGAVRELSQTIVEYKNENIILPDELKFDTNIAAETVSNIVRILENYSN